MINRAAINHWYKSAPWSKNVEVEQDLLLSRCIVAIFADEFLASQLAFRGGTALHKLYFHPQPRYSEDIDLVQINPGPIKPILQRLGEVLSFMPDKVIKQKKFNNTLLFRADSEIPPIVQMRLKIEINCVEHFNELGLVQKPFAVSSPWFTGACQLTTYQLEELLGTKLRALYQRKKGRDLFDLFHALTNASVDANKVLASYQRYMKFAVERPPSYRQFISNLEGKIQDPEFLGDTAMLLRPGLAFSPDEAYTLVRETFIERLPGRR